MARLGNAVPAGVETGYHLCYGTPNDEHLVMPRDLVQILADLQAEPPTDLRIDLVEHQQRHSILIRQRLLHRQHDARQLAA